MKVSLVYGRVDLEECNLICQTLNIDIHTVSQTLNDVIVFSLPFNIISTICYFTPKGTHIIIAAIVTKAFSHQVG